MFASGVASIINQVVWQRALKIYLAGNDSLSSMLVVFVYMFGMGVGSWIASRIAHRLINPLRYLMTLEILLAAINLVVCYGLSLDLQQSVTAFVLTGIKLGLQPHVLYSAAAVLAFTVPCIIMGMTIAIASEGAERQLGFSQATFLSRIFTLNTLGAVVGALVGSCLLLPLVGQQFALIIAALLNLGAGLSLAYPAAKLNQGPSSRPEENRVPTKSATPVSFGRLAAGFFLGFISLAYEMYLLRHASLIFTPLPYIFAAVLTAFLLLWAVGASFAGKIQRNHSFWLMLLSISLSLVMPTYFIARWGMPFGMGILFPYQAVAVSMIALLPCFFFGVLYTHLISEISDSWGQNVGQYAAINTFGCCLGVMIGTLVGFRLPPVVGLSVCGGIALVMSIAHYKPLLPRLPKHLLSGFLASLTIGLLILGFVIDHKNDGRFADVLYSPGGVVEIDRDRNVWLDGLWHSQLCKDSDYVGTTNWRMAVLPLLCTNSQQHRLKTCVIGMCTGVTAATLASSTNVESVDAYEINEGLARTIADYPEGTLNVGSNRKIQIFWEDGRVGMASRNRTYDLITQAPLYLKQAGSSTLLSQEYMSLVKKRLNPGGVFCIYSNSRGEVAQASMVLATARSIFRYCETFGDGYLIVASESPLDFSDLTIRARLQHETLLADECEAVGIATLVSSRDTHQFVVDQSFLITDDRPLIEHPWLIRQLGIAELPLKQPNN